VNIEEIYDRLGNKVHHYLTIKLGSASDAEDVLQEVFCRLVRYPLRLRFIRNAGPFVFRIARNEANRFIRQRIHNREREKVGGAGDGQVIAHSLAGPDEPSRQWIGEALARISEEQREIIVLKTFEGMTFKQIATVCGISLNTAASRYRYGLEKMRQILGEKDEKPK
jgi:RNA polymerase sigma-70 factor (ECF subfamily)